jgi:glutamate synthase domain-containing protein 2
MAEQPIGMLTKPQMEAVKQRDDALYERYAKHLENEHRGKFVVISLDGQIMTGKDRVELLWAAADKFGEGNFTLRKIGCPYVLKWR